MKAHVPSGWVTRSGGWRLLLWLALASVMLASGFDGPFFVSGHHDAHFFWHHEQAAVASYRLFGEFPAWNPYFCGGIVGVGNLQTNVAGPTFLLRLLFGQTVGFHLAMTFFLVMAMEGTFRYARHLGADGAGALLAATAWGLSGRFAAALAETQYGVPSTGLVPWVLLGFELGFERPMASALGGLAMGAMLLEGGILPVPLSVVVLTVLVLVFTIEAVVFKKPWRWWAPLRSFVLLGITAVGFSAVKLLPTVEVALAFPRIWQGRDSYTVEHLLAMVFERTVDYGYIGRGTSYVGLGTAALALVALAMGRRAAWLRAIVFFLLLSIATGQDGLLGLYDLLQKLPFYRDLRAPYRYTFFLGFFAAVVAGLGLTAMETSLASAAVAVRGWWLRHLRWAGMRTLSAAVAWGGVAAVALGVAALSTADVLGHNVKRLAGIYTLGPAIEATGPFRQSLGNRWDAHVWAPMNLGSLNCFDETPYPMSPLLRADLAAEEYPVDPSSATVVRRSWSPHRIVLDVNAVRPATVRVNQNWHRGWHATGGTSRSDSGLLAVDVPAGRSTVELRFSDPVVNAGGAISLLTVVLVAISRARSGRRRPPPPRWRARGIGSS